MAFRSGTYRRGRTVYTGDHDPDCSRLFWRIIVGLGFAGLTAKWLWEEYNVRNIRQAMDEIQGHALPLDLTSPTLSSPSHVQSLEHKLVSFSAQPNQLFGTVHDPAFELSVPGMKLQRNTEYCQWHEISNEVCETCSRRKNDGKTETYSCNCQRRYHYIKRWSSYRINSLFFNQPGAHYNPQRDPYPTETFLSRNAKLLMTESTGENKVDSKTATPIGIRLHRDLLKQVKSHSHRFKPLSPYDKELHGFAQSIAYYGHEDTNRGGLFGSSNPAGTRVDRFVYAGDGYFFSPYEEGLSTTLLKKFAQWMEGSILDYQLGDLWPSCTAGDIRISYDIYAPKTLSGIAEVYLSPSEQVGVTTKEMVLSLHRTSKELDVGILREGIFSEDMLIHAEIGDAESQRLIWRLLLLFAILLYGVYQVFCSPRSCSAVPGAIPGDIFGEGKEKSVD